MRLETSNYIVLALEEAIRMDNMLGRHWPKKGSSLRLPWPSAEFDRLMAVVGQTNAPLRISARLFLDAAEIDTIDLWELQLDSFIALSSAEERWLKGKWPRLEIVPGSRSVRRFREFRFSRDRFNSGSISGMPGVLFFPSELVNKFQEFGLSGATWGSVTDLAGETEWGGAKLLVPERVIGPLIRDAATESMVDNDGAELVVPRAWAIAFDAEVISSAADFNITVDPIAGYDLGSTVVSKRVRTLIDGSGVHGVFFTPVLDASSELYSNFISQWHSLSAQVVARTENRLK